jgi:hypothetical protein
MSDSSPGAAVAGTFSRRTLLVATLAGTAVVAVGCTAEPGDAADAVTEAQVDQLAAQVDVQTALVAAYDRALAVSPELAVAAAGLAEQARQQLERLRAAAPGSDTSSSATSSAAAPLDPAGARDYLSTEVARAADTHATACPGFSGARAALLGSIAAGLRGQLGQLGQLA